MSFAHGATRGELTQDLEGRDPFAPLDSRDVRGAAARKCKVPLAETLRLARSDETLADGERIVDVRYALSLDRHRDRAALTLDNDTPTSLSFARQPAPASDTPSFTPRDEWSSLERGSSLGAMIELGTEKKAAPITARQREVVALIAAGCSNDEVGARLGISPRTAKAHCDVLRQKLGVRRRRQIPIAFRLLTGEDPLSITYGWALRAGSR